MFQESTSPSKSVAQLQCMFAKFGEGHWYAIPQAMEDSFRRAGALVSYTEHNAKDEQNDFGGMTNED